MQNAKKTKAPVLRDIRECMLCGNAYALGETEDRVCPACLAEASGGAGIDQGRRRHLRIEVERPVRLRVLGREYDGRLTNVSYGGAAVSTAELPVAVDQIVALESDAFGTLSGPVVRTFCDGFAISFDMDERAKTPLAEWVAGNQAGRPGD